MKVSIERFVSGDARSVGVAPTCSSCTTMGATFEVTSGRGRVRKAARRASKLKRRGRRHVPRSVEDAVVEAAALAQANASSLLAAGASSDLSAAIQHRATPSTHRISAMGRPDRRRSCSPASNGLLRSARRGRG